MKRFIVVGAAFGLMLGARAAVADENGAPSEPLPRPDAIAPVTPEAPKIDVDVNKLGPNVQKDVIPDCGTTSCPYTACFDDEGGQDICHHAAGGTCSGDIDTGYTQCIDGAYNRKCLFGATVHLKTCPCSCLNESCGTHIVFKGCQLPT
jgi:hypothetical protein